MLYAVIDIGSTTIRMAIYEILDNKLNLIHKRKYTVGLASYVKDNVMEQAGIDKACEILNSFKSFLTSFNIENVSAFTTAALRNAQNSKEAVAEIIARTGIDLHIISGDEEATYDFIAATHELDYHDGFIIDIGGASTELIRFADNKIIQKTSLPIGSLALHTKYATDFLPSEEEIAQMIKEVHAIIDTAPEFKDISHAEMCGIGGTCKGARALYNEMYAQDDANETIPADKIPEMISHFTRGHKLTDKDITTLLKTVPDRLHTIIPGMVIANEIAKLIHATAITYKDAGMREGFLYTHVIEGSFFMQKNNDILQILFSYQNKKDAQLVQKLLPKNINRENIKIIGIRLPQLRKIAKDLVKNNWQEFLNQNTNEYFEQIMLEGFVIAYAPIDINAKQKLIQNFLPKINNWSICDSFCASFQLKTKDKDLYLSFIKNYLNSPNEYELRFAIVMLLDYYLTEDFADNALQLVYNTKDISYSVNMAKAWAFSKYFTFYPDKGLNFLQTKSLSKDVFKMTCQKIRDSRRVSSRYKEALKNL
mgnify:FL=1